MRGPGVLPARPGRPLGRTARERFDDLALGIITELDDRWQDRLALTGGAVEYAVEDIPEIPDDWTDQPVPLSSLVRGSADEPTRLVLFRRPIEQRCETPEDLAALVLTVVVEQFAELLALPAEEIDPRYHS